MDIEGIVRRRDAKLDRKYIEKTLRALCDLGEGHAVLERWRALRSPRA